MARITFLVLTVKAYPYALRFARDVAVFTQLSEDDAKSILAAHGREPLVRIEPVAAGSVNSSFVLVTDCNRYFLRVYEVQNAEGVRSEWSVLEALARRGIPVPRLAVGENLLGPGSLRVHGKPAVLMEIVSGTELCQRSVRSEHMTVLGKTVARIHAALENHPPRSSGFTLDTIQTRLDTIDTAAHPELTATVSMARKVIQTCRAQWPIHARHGIVHGDLFRDNVRWDGHHIVAVIDWEAAGTNVLLYDLAVVMLAWCFGDEWDWELARAFVSGYRSERGLDSPEIEALRTVLLFGAARFTTTRILDFYLRPSLGERVYKDYRRFEARMKLFLGLTNDEIARKLGLDA